jgi:hypothetical protein
VPRYFFHLRNDLNADDEEGAELPDLDAARERAKAFALDMAAASILEHQKLNLHHRIEIADASGAILEVIEFRDVLTLVG